MCTHSDRPPASGTECMMVLYAALDQQLAKQPLTARQPLARLMRGRRPVSLSCRLLWLLPASRAQPTFPECTGIMAMSSPSGSVHGPWHGPTLIYQPSNYTTPNGTVTPPPGGAEWYSGVGIDNPTLVITANGTSLLSGRTCSGPEHPWVASAPHWTGPFRSIDNNSQPFPQLNVE
jgi:hypothetical protein